MHTLPTPLSPTLALVAATALLVLPLVLLAHWIVVAKRGGDDAWFRFQTRVRLLALAAVSFTTPSMLALGLERVLAPQDGLAGLPMWFARWAPGIFITLVHLAAVAFAERRVRRRLRGAGSRATDLRASLLPLLASMAPLLGMLGALVAMQQHAWRSAAGSALAGFALALWLNLRRPHVLGLAPEAVTTGPLRERVFLRADSAGVGVEQLFVLAARDAHLSNAFAVQGRRVLLTDTLLEQLSRREVDAVVAHELAHLRFHHPRLLGLSYALPSSIVWAFSHWLGAWTFAASNCVAFLVLVAMSRRFEYAADRQAVAWTRDPAALITGIARISNANGFPLDWGRVTGWMLTHPSTRARALALVREGALPAADAEHLLATLPQDADRWPFTLDSVTPIAGSVARSRGNVAAAWGSFVACALGATLVVELARRSPARWPELPLVAAGAAVAWLLLLATFDALAVAATRGWRGPLAKRLAVDAHAHYVGLSPGEEPRLYEGLSDWDVGFLSANAIGFSYRGERAQVVLSRERIRGVTAVAGVPGWFAAPRVAVRWLADDGTLHAFTLRDANVSTMHRMRAANATLAKALRDALASGEGCAASTPQTGAPPDPSEVTSQDPWRAQGWRSLPALVVPLAALSCAATLLTGLPFAPHAGPGALDVFASIVCAALLMRAPLLLPRPRDSDRPRSLDRAA